MRNRCPYGIKLVFKALRRYDRRMRTLRPKVEIFHDYRELLKSWIQFLQSNDKSYSLRRLAQESGVSQTLISLVLVGKRNLALKSARALCSGMHMTTTEQSFFLSLVQLSEGKTQNDRMLAYQKIKRFSKYQDKNSSQIEAYRYLSEWHLVALRELVVHPEFKGDLRWAQKQFNFHVSLKELKTGLQFLIEHGFVVRKSRNHFLQTQRHLNCLDGIFQLSLNRFHQQILELSKRAMDELPKESRHFSGYTFMMSENSYQKVVDLLEQTQAKIQEIEQQDQTALGRKAVYHIENIIFPMMSERQTKKLR